jgi:ABC-type antimicrobial peptide transport system permease subunit
MRRFVRFAAIGFTLFSVLFWDLAFSIADIVRDDPRALGLRSGSSVTTWLVFALPAILYGVLSVLYFHWFAKRLVRKATPRKPDVQ